MLWYKAWLETRMRFVIALVLCVAVRSELMISLPRLGSSKVDVVGLHGIPYALLFVWIIGTTLIMMGGLLSEKTIGSSSFTAWRTFSATAVKRITVSENAELVVDKANDFCALSAECAAGACGRSS